MMRQYRFTSLLVALLLLMLLVPSARHLTSAAFPIISSVFVTVLFSAVLLSAVFAVCTRRKTVLLARSGAALVIVVAAANALWERPFLLITENVLAIGFLVYVLVLLLRFLFRDQQVTFETIAASLCGYLLIGLLWASIYTLLQTSDASAFSFPDTAERKTLGFGGEGTAVALYFSYVTLTTLGFGDIVPLSPFARMACTVEAITGQLYLTVLVARLVGLHIARAASEDSS